MTPWIVLPMRGFVAGKTRLAGVLEPSTRAALNRWLFLRTADLARRAVAAAHILVVTPDPAVEAAASGLGLATLVEPAGAGLNGALTLGRAAAQAAGASHVLSLSCDLPLLLLSDIRALIARAEAADGVVIATDRAGTGTNALVVPAGDSFRYAMGQTSAARHRVAAAECGLRTGEMHRPGLSFDLDLPSDLEGWRAIMDIAA